MCIKTGGPICLCNQELNQQSPLINYQRTVEINEDDLTSDELYELIQTGDRNTRNRIIKQLQYPTPSN